MAGLPSCLNSGCLSIPSCFTPSCSAGVNSSFASNGKCRNWRVISPFITFMSLGGACGMLLGAGYSPTSLYPFVIGLGCALHSAYIARKFVDLKEHEQLNQDLKGQLVIMKSENDTYRSNNKRFTASLSTLIDITGKGQLNVEALTKLIAQTEQVAQNSVQNSVKTVESTGVDVLLKLQQTLLSVINGQAMKDAMTQLADAAAKVAYHNGRSEVVQAQLKRSTEELDEVSGKLKNNVNELTTVATQLQESATAIQQGSPKNQERTSDTSRKARTTTSSPRLLPDATTKRKP